ncbi:hypothetical protein ACFLS4_01220 [Bacteroidota bacterium]
MLKITPIAYPGAPQDVLKRGESILKNKLGIIDFEFTDINLDALFIITGGSESKARNILKNVDRILILAMTENNSYAAASEIKAYCNKNNIKSILYNIDNEANIDNKLEMYSKCNIALNNILKYKVGLIGEVSEWLINSEISDEILKTKLGIQLEKIAWSEFSNYSEFALNDEFIEHFKDSELDIKDSSKVYNLLTDIITKKQLSAITVECFPLVREHAVTACLALSRFNTNGIPAGCEGDITSITGKIIVKELTGQIPWMANLAAVEDEIVFFAHCTIATDLVDDFKINTHFETNQGTAIHGKFKSEEVTVFRLNKDLTKAFLSYGEIIERPEREDSCRTQIKVKIPFNDVEKLKENPLGNHHLIVPGDHRDLIQFFLKFIKIEIV